MPCRKYVDEKIKIQLVNTKIGYKESLLISILLIIHSSAFPRIYPMAVPIRSCIIIVPITSHIDRVVSAFMILINVMVSTYAIGSLLPLSNSSIGLRLFLRRRPFERKIENTDAESVEDIVAAINIAVRMPTDAEAHVFPSIQKIAKPVIKAVSTTPTVASTTP